MDHTLSVMETIDLDDTENYFFTHDVKKAADFFTLGYSLAAIYKEGESGKIRFIFRGNEFENIYGSVTSVDKISTVK